jgi:hypothetical protein
MFLRFLLHCEWRLEKWWGSGFGFCYGEEAHAKLSLFQNPWQVSVLRSIEEHY